MWRYDDKTTRSFDACWRKAIRRLYNIPYRTHNILVHHIINSYPIAGACPGGGGGPKGPGPPP